MGEEVEETRGHRVYLIREALGTRRDPMPLPKFAELIAATTGVVYDKSTISRMETGERKVSLEDIEAIAPVDPLKRGRAWLAGWDDEDDVDVPADRPPTVVPTRFTDNRLPPEPTQPSPAKPKTVTRKPGRSAVA